KKAVAYLTPYMEAEKEEAGTVGQARAKVLMATVKGDVHDIGKNIVGVVLGCNNYEITDLGVMVPAEKILDTAVAEGASMIGLSGLITPSLDEMVQVGNEMTRRGLDLPLLIGGATTSRLHTALKIEPAYAGPTVWVKDASRAVGVAQKLISPDARKAYLEEVAADYETVRLRRAARPSRKRFEGLDAARANASVIDWASYAPPAPKEPGIRVERKISLAELVPYIDWTPFFQTWELAGRFPAILDDEIVGEQARGLYDDARAMLQQMVDEDWLEASAVTGLFPAVRDGDDVLVYEDAAAEEPFERLCFLRQQIEKAPGRPHLCLADFVSAEHGQDHIGLFAVTTGIGIEAHVARFEAEHDDYSVILCQALADRLAEALAERTHALIRQERWGYAADEQLDNTALIAERYRGIRPAPGYPACPDHSEKRKIFRLLDVEANVGMKLTESCAMWPAAAVSGYYFSHPESRYFVVGQLREDQIQDYADRKGVGLDEAERWLAPNLAYDPERS
ncbi:MAG: vitamin B12 dependent-methionine synthase activation domain-containing protein, partial [Pseudomonadota bacterium]